MLPEDIKIAIRMELDEKRISMHVTVLQGKRYEYYIDTREKPDVFDQKIQLIIFPMNWIWRQWKKQRRILIGTHEFDSIYGYETRKKSPH